MSEKISITYYEIDKMLLSQDGAFGIRVVVNEGYVAVEKFDNGEWSIYNSIVYDNIRLKRIAIREAYKVLKSMQIFDPECEFIAKNKFETNASGMYQRDYRLRKTQEKRENKSKRVQNILAARDKYASTKEYTIDQIQEAAEKYENLEATVYELTSTMCGEDGLVQPSIHMQFDAMIVRVLDFWVEDTGKIVRLAVVDANIPLESIQFHPTYRSIDLTLDGSDKLRIDELMRKVEAL